MRRGIKMMSGRRLPYNHKKNNAFVMRVYFAILFVDGKICVFLVRAKNKIAPENKIVF